MKEARDLPNAIVADIREWYANYKTNDGEQPPNTYFFDDVLGRGTYSGVAYS